MNLMVIANKKTGVDNKINDEIPAKRSKNLYCLTALITPIKTPITEPKIEPIKSNLRLTQIFSPKSGLISCIAIV